APDIDPNRRSYVIQVEGHRPQPRRSGKLSPVLIAAAFGLPTLVDGVHHRLEAHERGAGAGQVRWCERVLLALRKGERGVLPNDRCQDKECEPMDLVDRWRFHVVFPYRQAGKETTVASSF